MAYWKTIRTNQIPQKNKKSSRKSKFQCTVAILCVTSQCAAVMCYCCIFMNMNGVTFFNSKLKFCVITYSISLIWNVLSAWKYGKCKTFCSKLETNYKKKKKMLLHLDLHFTSVNIICTYSFCIFFVRCFLNFTLIIKKKATVILSSNVWVRCVQWPDMTSSYCMKQSVLKLFNYQ